MILSKFFMNYAPDWANAIIFSIFSFLHPHTKGVLFIPQRKGWVAYSGKEKFFTPKPTNVKHTKKCILRKYTLKPHVTVEEGDIVFDIGSYIGGFTLATAERANKVFAIEPDPINYMFLSRNTKNRDNVSTINVACGEQNEKMKLYQGLDPTDSSLINVDGAQTSNIDIEVIPLSDLVKSLGVEEIDFLKVEAEGAETEVLRGMDLTKVKKAAVDCSAERFNEKPRKNVEILFKSCGFSTLSDSQDIVYAWKEP